MSAETLHVISLFSGIGGIDLAFERAGMTTALLCERDKHATAVLNHHWPHIPVHPDVSELTPDDLRDAAPDPDRAILAAGFPCFPAGTLVLTKDGYRPIEQIRVGDRVLTHTGAWQPVVQTMNRLADETVTVTAQGVPAIETTSEHPFFARHQRRVWVGRENGSWKREWTRPSWIEAGDLNGTHVAQVVPAEARGSALDAEFWWVAGRFVADGWLTTGKRGKRTRAVFGVGAHKADEFEKRIAPVVHATRTKDRTAVKFIVTQSWFVELMRPYGHLAHNKTIGRRELDLPAHLAEAFLDGYMSGDGYTDPTGTVRASSTSKALILGLAVLAQRAKGVVASINYCERPKTTVIEGRTVNQRDTWSLHIPPRNRSAFVEGIHGWKRVRKVQRATGSVRVYNIGVERDESYVADGAVVHNCQDLSVAGARRGMGEGTRSGLYWHIPRLLAEYRARWVVLENVPGLLSAVCVCPGDGRCQAAGYDAECGAWVRRAGQREWVANAEHSVPGGACAGGCIATHGGVMGAVIGSLGELGYGLAYRVLDAQFFGVPQRRRRVVIVGRLGDSGAAPAQVLLEPEGSGGDLAPCHASRSATAAEVARGADETGRIAYALTEAHGLGSDPAVSGTLGAHATGGWGGDDIDRTGTFVSHTFQKVVRSGARGENGDLPAEVWAERRVAATLSPHDLGSETRAVELVVEPLALRGRDDGAQLEVAADGAPAHTLRTPGGGSSHPMVAVTTLGERTHSLTAEGHDASEDGTRRGTPVVAYQQQGSNVGEMGTLRAGNGSHTAGVPFVAFQPDTGGDTAMSIGETAPCLSVGQKAAVMGETVVRRLTPLECTRLQGLPDGWVDVPGNSESQQYKQLGNSVAAPVFEWVGNRIVAVDEALRAKAGAA